MKSDKYWAKRAEKRMDYAMLSSNEVSGRIGAAYLEALRDIQEQLQAIFRSFSADITDAEAKRILQRVPIDRDADITELLKQAIALVKDDKERAELIAELNVPAYKARMQRLKELSQDIGDKCTALAQEADSSLDRGLEQVIRDTYYRGVFDMQQRTGIAFSFSKVSERMIREILQQAWSGRHYSKRIWQNTDTLAAELRQTLLKGVLTGKSSGRMAAEIQDRFHASYSRALTLVRTEHSYCANSAELARYKDIDVKKYRFVATLDSHTSEICRDLDGQEFPVEDAAPGTNYPPMHPRCRSTTIEALSAALMQKLERRARDPETGKLMTVPADMTYREWYGKYVEGGELTDGAKLQAAEPRFKFIEAKTIEEAEKIALENGVRHVDYSDLPLETANLLNEAAMTLPEDIRPAYIGSGKGVQKVTGTKFSRKEKDYYGVHIDALQMHFGEYPNIEYDFEGGNVVGISTAYKTPEKIHKSKVEGNKVYAEKHDGHTQFFNEDGRSTAFHEMGHIYADKKGIPKGFAEDAERWLKDSKCDMLKSTDEAWAEAWGAYHTNNPNLPDYIAKYISDATNKHLTQPTGNSIIKSEVSFDGKIYKKKSSDFKTIRLNKREYKHLMSEIASNLSEEQKSSEVFIKYCGDYQYIVENHGFGYYRVISRRKIK